MTERIRIVRAIARLNVGGPARHVVWLTAALNDAEFETALVTGTVPPGEDDMSGFATTHGVEPLIIREMSREISPRDLITIWKMYRLLVRKRPHVVHTHTAKAGTVGRIAGLMYRYLTPGTLIGRPRRCALIHTFHGHIFHSYYGRLKTSMFLAIERALARLATDRLVVLSAQQLDEINGRFRVGRRSQFRIVPLGLDLDELRAVPALGATMRRSLGIAESETVVGIVGRLTAIKNHDLFLRVAAAFRGRARFVVFGDGAERVRLEALSKTLGADAVFAGTHDPAAIYATIDVAALTSLNEGTPLTLIEAMANGIPVISTAVGGVPDITGDVVDHVGGAGGGYDVRTRGVTAGSGDADAFVAGLERLLADSALRQELSERGRAHVHATHGKERLIADIAKLTRETCGR